MAAILFLQAQATGGSQFLTFLPMVLIFAIFYVLIFVPQRRQQKAHRELVGSLAKGDQVVTAGGLVGEVVQVKDDTVLLRTGQSTVVVERERIARRSAAAPK